MTWRRILARTAVLLICRCENHKNDCPLRILRLARAGSEMHLIKTFDPACLMGLCLELRDVLGQPNPRLLACRPEVCGRIQPRRIVRRAPSTIRMAPYSVGPRAGIAQPWRSSCGTISPWRSPLHCFDGNGFRRADPRQALVQCGTIQPAEEP